MPRKIEVSHKTILFTLFTLGALWFIWEIRAIVLILFVAILVMVILNPLVKKLSKYKVPRALSILIVYFSFFAMVIISLVSIIPALIDQTTNFASGLPGYISNLHVSSAIGDQVYSQFLSRVGDVPGEIVNIGVLLLTNIITLLTMLTFAFYLLMARNKIGDQLAFLVGNKKAEEIDGFLDELEIKLGGWARGQIVLMVSVGLFNYIGFLLIGIPYALPLAILAGFLEAVPYVGPIIAAVPAVAIGFGISPLTGLATAALAFLIQQVENYVLIPKVMERSVGVSPIVTLLSLAIGLQIAGITGVLISVPVVITLQVLVKRHFLV